MSVFPIKKVFFFLFRDHYYFWETMAHVRLILKHLCLGGMIGIIQSKITWFWGYILLPLLCFITLISPNLMLSRSFLSQFWPGVLSQNCWKKPWKCIKYDKGMQQSRTTDQPTVSRCREKTATWHSEDDTSKSNIELFSSILIAKQKRTQKAI